MSIFGIQDKSVGINLNNISIAAFKLFDSIFSSDYFCSYFYIFNMKKYRKSIQKRLIILINDYMKNDDHDDDDDNDNKYDSDNSNNKSIPVYMKQIFSNLVDKKIKSKKLYIIKSEYKFLCADLRDKLFKIVDNNNNKIKPFTFLSNILNNNNNIKKIKFVKEYILFLNKNQLKLFNNLKKDKEYIPQNADDYVYKINDNEDNDQLRHDNYIKFIPSIYRSTSSFPNNAGFGIEITYISPLYNSVKLNYSYCIDELKYCRNNYYAGLLKKGSFYGSMSFANSKLDNNKISSLTLRIAMLFFGFK